MTREEAIKVIRKMLAYTDLSVRANLTSDMVEACRLAIKALEQEPILDKIRAEIERQEKWLMDAGYNAYNVDIAFSSIKLVVNKYKTELEIIDSHISGKENT